MPTNINNEKINMNMAQIRVALKKNMITYQNDTKWILKKINNINYQVVDTKYLRSKHTDWIGNTALHFAAIESKSDAFDIFLNHGANFTIKNRNGLTALHLIIQKLANSYSILHKLLHDPFVKSVLSAHVQTKNFENPVNQNGLSHFHVACAVNNVEAINGFLHGKVLIDHAVKMDSPLFPGCTPLHFAAKYCAFEAIDLLLTHGADIHIKDAKGMTALHVALERKLEIIHDIDANELLRVSYEKILQLLLSKESNSDMVIIDNWGLSNLHVSSALKDSKIAEQILQKVVKINDTVHMESPLWAGYTALHFAALCNMNLVKSLMERGADINIKNAKGVTPFDMCIERYENKDISKIISLNPIWKNIMLSDGKTKLSDLVFAMGDSNQFNAFFSELSGDISLCKNSPLWPKCSPMHLVVILAKKDAKANEESEEINLQILRDQYKQNPRMLYSKDLHNHTPLHLAFLLNKKPLINLLLQFVEEDPNLFNHINKDHLFYLHIASAENQITLLKRLLWMGINLNAVYEGKPQSSPLIYSGSTPLHFAVINGSEEAADILVKRGANVYAKDANDMTPIHLLLLSEATTNMCNILLSRLNLKNSTVSGIGLSHLHVASWFQCGEKTDVVKRLLDNGADVNATITCQQNHNKESNILSLLKRYEGHSPLIFAVKQENHATVNLLLQRDANIFIEYTKGVALLYYVLENSELSVDNFLETVKRDIDGMTSVETATGMTLLHLACFDLNSELIQKSLNEGAKVNAQISPGSPILQGYTPLHILMHVAEQNDHDNVMKIAKLLLKAGADVTLQDSFSETAVHAAFNTFSDNSDDKDYLLVNILLEEQRDFSVNPTSTDGISHFHIACHMCNARVARKFLSCGKIDINQQIYYFSYDKAGYTALQLAAGSDGNVCRVLSQLDTVDLLMNHGADVNIEDHFGDNPFHECIRHHSIDIFQRLVRSKRGKRDVNARNINGKTPMYYYLESNKESEESEEEPEEEPDRVSLEGIKTLMRFGCRLNTFCALTHVGYLGKMVDALPHKHVHKLFSVLPVNFKKEMKINNLYGTAIHNIVSIKPPKICSKEYAELIGQLSRIGYDIDVQNNSGRTALHLAVKFYNFEAISGLLLVGADINVVDNNDKTALVGDFNSCEQCEDEDEEYKKRCQCHRTLETLTIYIKKLQSRGLYVDKPNEDFMSKAFETLQSGTALPDEFFNELETVKSTKIEPHSLTLYNFLSEYGTVVDYPRMSEMKRNDIDNFFSPNGAQKLRKQFPELAGILQLQYRKARVRCNLLEPAKESLKFLIPRFPDGCLYYILALMKNSELKSLIASVSSTENVK